MANIAKIGINRLFMNSGLRYLTGGDKNFIRNIISKATIPEHFKPTKPKPWPYNEKSYNWLSARFDKTSSRFDENSVVNKISASSMTFFNNNSEDSSCGRSSRIWKI